MGISLILNYIGNKLMIKNLLSALDFSEKESQIYLALLEVGSGKAQDIAKKTGLNRTTVYDIFEVLMQNASVL